MKTTRPRISPLASLGNMVVALLLFSAALAYATPDAGDSCAASTERMERRWKADVEAEDQGTVAARYGKSIRASRDWPPAAPPAVEKTCRDLSISAAGLWPRFWACVKWLISGG